MNTLFTRRPRPWHVMNDWIGDANDETVAYMSDHRNQKALSMAERTALAQLIVTAVNNQDRPATCQNCRFWRRLKNGFGECSQPKLEADQDLPASDALRVFDSEENPCELVLETGPGFGCIHFESQEET
jgi:hypothetical protein